MDNDTARDPKPPESTIPPDDPARSLAVARPGDPGLPCVALVGDAYTILITGEQTAGRYCLIDMQVPPGGGPPPHRHDFEEMFAILEGEIEFTFRGEPTVVRAGGAINIPANSPHNFRNASETAARMLCMCTPAGQEEFFLEIGDLLAGPDAPLPKLTEADLAERKAKALALAAKYRTEFLPPPEKP